MVKQKLRTVVTTDGEIDDMNSFIRFLLYSNGEKCTWAERRANPLPASGSFPPFPLDWETPVCRLRRGGHKCHKKGCNFPHNYDIF